MVNRAPWVLLALSAGCFLCNRSPAATDQLLEHVPTLQLQRYNLSLLLRDNSLSPATLSGIDSLFNHHDAPEFDAFDPDGRGASAGLNFEHIICGHSNIANAFAPRHGRYDLYRLADSHSALLVRQAEDDPWRFKSTFKYSINQTNAIDFRFECKAQAPELFGSRGYAVLFFANYMNEVEALSIHFRGVSKAGGDEQWISAEAPAGHMDYNHGGTYISAAARPLEYDTNHNFKLNLWNYEFPRFTEPFYYGRVSHGMVFILMFDRMHTAADEMRFSLFKFKVPRHPRPAWDFQYVIHRVQAGRSYGFSGRLVWKKFVSPEDCWNEYRRWKAEKQ